MPPAARVSDMHTCPMVTGVVPHVGGPILPPCAVTVITGGMPQARVGDMLVCVGPPDVIAKGSASVVVSGMPAARMGDNTAHGGVIVIGFPTVIIGDAGGGAAPGMALAKAGALGNAVAQAKAMIAAAKDGAPFCEKCAAAAGSAPAPVAKPPAPSPAPAAGTPVVPDAALLKQSPTLTTQLDALKKDGWTIEYGKAGGGSFCNKRLKQIVIDPSRAADPKALTRTLSHEVGHALYKASIDSSTKAAYIRSQLADEGAATLNNILVQREIIANKGPDIGISGNPANQAAYNKAFDAFVKDGNATAARDAIGAIFGSGEKTSTTGQSYSDYYGAAFDRLFPPKKGP